MNLDPEHSNPIFSQYTVSVTYNVINDAPAKKVWMQKDQQFRRSSRNSHVLIYDLLSFTVALTLKIAKHLFFHMTHQHTNFGDKQLSGLIKPRRRADGWTQTVIPRPSFPSDKLCYGGYNDEDLIST